MDDLRSEQLERLACQTVQYRASVDAAKEHLEEALYQEIGALPRGPERFTLLAVRRRVHQEKELRLKELDLVAEHPSVSDAWRSYKDAMTRYSEAKELYHARHRADLQDGLRTVRRLAEVPATASAMALASPTLSEALSVASEETEKPGVDKLFGSLARYVYRACTKTSPFSTLTVVSEGALGPRSMRNGSRAAALRENGAEVRNVSLTGYLQEAIWEHTALSPRLRNHMPCSLNPTIVSEPPVVSWYTTIGNLGVTRRMRAPWWLDEFSSRVAARPRSVGEATALLATVGAFDPETAEDVTLQLLRAGFLVSDPPASALDPEWSRHTRRWFEDLARREPAAALIPHLLTTLEEEAGELSQAAPAERVGLLSEAENLVVQVLGSTHMPRFLDRPPRPGKRSVPTVGERGQGRLSRNSLFYEDVKGSLTLDLPAQDVGDLCEDLNAMAEHCVLLNPIVTARKGLALLLERRFGPDVRTPLMSLFAEVQRHRLAAAEAEVEGDEYVWEYPEGREVLAEQVRLSTAWSAAVVEEAARAGRLDDSAAVELSIDDLRVGEAFLAGWIDPPSAVSRSATVQVGRLPDGSPQWVMHSPIISQGLGRMYSRFLPVLSREFTEDLRAWNAGLPYGAALMENLDGSRFNGNAHPWLVPAEVALPNGNHRRTGGINVPIAGLDVRLRDGRIDLVERGTDQVRVPCHLGFQTRGRNAVFEILDAFSVDGSVYMFALIEKLNARWRSLHHRKEEDQAPRITFQERLVIQRRCWRLPSSLAERAGDLSPAAWFVDLNRWRRESDLPPAVFYRVPVRKEDLQRKHRKPQYLAFDDPLACELFRTVAARVAGREVRLEEVLPTSDQMPAGPKGRHSTEVTVCWYIQ